MTDANIEVYRLRSTGSVIDADGADLGRVGDIYLGDAGKPEWVTVKTDRFGTRERFIPLAQARIDGDQIYVPYHREMVAAAPHFAADTVLTPDEEAALSQHYGLHGTAAPADDATN